MIMPWDLIRAIVIAILILWVLGSLIIAALRPWRHFEQADRWLAWALLFGWPFIFGAMAIELTLEWRLDRKDARRVRVR